MEKEDIVNHPKHYISANGMEVIDVIDEFTADLVGRESNYTSNIIKYILRWKHKNGVTDLKKANWYLERLIKYLEEKEK